jgi:hypothetical protein
MPIPQFFLQNPNDHEATFDEAYELYTATSTGASRFLHLNDPAHPSCMKVSCIATNQGVYKQVSVGGNERHIVEFAYVCSSGRIRAKIYDQTNTATIYQASITNTEWANFYKQITTPASCRLLRLYLLKASTVNAPFFIDDVRIQGNMLLADPDDYDIDYQETTRDHQVADGGRVTDRTGKHAAFKLAFPSMTATAFAKLREGGKGSWSTYFDDGNVPNVKETFVVRATASKTYAGVTQGASDKAYYSATTATPLQATNFQVASFSNTSYSNIATSGSSTYATYAITGTGKYGYHKFVFNVTTYGSKLHIKSFSVKYEGSAQDASPNGVHGVNLYAWNGLAWVLVGRSRTQDTQTIAFDTTKSEQAQQFVDVSANSVRILAQTRMTKDIGGDLTLKTNYIGININQNRGYTKHLLNKAVLSATGGVISVKNLVTGSTLILNQATTGYRIGDDRKSVVITADQVSGSYIEIKYRQYYNVAVQSIRQPMVYGGDIAQPKSRVELQLKTLSPIEKVE